MFPIALEPGILIGCMLIFLPRHATAAGVLVGSVFIFRDPGRSVRSKEKKVFHTIDERWGVGSVRSCVVVLVWV
jgi:hypothetical protein